jgi:ATP-binding cassette subfamily G (WHITE) protein 2 (PDR)
MIVFFIYASTLGQLVIAALPDAQTASAIVTLLFSMTLIVSSIKRLHQPEHLERS